jgi:tetratricopeptide (TPR) repeat protein
MKKIILFTTLIFAYTLGICQDINSKSDALLKELAESGCMCIDSIQSFNKIKTEVSLEINKCLDEATGAYQLGSKLIDISDLSEASEETDEVKDISISINIDEDSKDYKKYYYELERYMMDNCPSLKDILSNNDKLNDKSFTDNEIALRYYSHGIEESENGNFEEAVENFQKAVKVDPEFAFAWDNLGISYRMLNKFDEAIDAYEKSLEIDPNGMMPLQNIAVAYQYKKEYKKAIKAYKKLAIIDKSNPEVFYGIGNVYTINLKDYEEGLDYLCKAYNMYIEQKSPYRTDAEKLINYIYSEMKEQGKEEKFNQILEANHISQN